MQNIEQNVVINEEVKSFSPALDKETLNPLEADRQENSAHEKQKPEPKSHEPKKTQTSDPVVRYIVNGVYSDLQKHSSDKEALKTALGACINILESFYLKL